MKYVLTESGGPGRLTVRCEVWNLCSSVDRDARNNDVVGSRKTSRGRFEKIIESYMCFEFARFERDNRMCPGRLGEGEDLGKRDAGQVKEGGGTYIAQNQVVTAI